MRAQHTIDSHVLLRGPSASSASRADSIFRALNRRAAMLSVSDDATVAKCLSASASAMIADSLCRLTAIEPEGCSDTSPAPTTDGAPLLKLVGCFDDEP